MNGYPEAAPIRRDLPGQGLQSDANILTDQAIAGVVLQELQNKQAELIQRLGTIAENAVNERQAAYDALNEALSYVEKVRDFASPEHLGSVLGPMATKHGEIAEQVEVQITNAKQVFNGLETIADIDSVGRTAPEDFIINGVPYQSKFIAGFNKSLDHVLQHMDKYPDFAVDATKYGYPGQAGCYVIPKDQYETIQKILGGDTGEFNSKTINACRNFVAQIEEQTGKSFGEVVKPSISDYSEVQIGTIDKTLNRYDEEFRDETAERVKIIDKDEKQQKEAAVSDAGPSLAEGVKATVIGAAIGGAVTASIKIYVKIRSGKKITEFQVDDWKEVGMDFGKGAIRGGVSGAGIFCLTRLAGFSAPFAGGMVSAGIGITSLLMDYRGGKITASEFSEASCALSFEAGLSAVGSAIGTALIPVPVVGTVVGAMAARAAIEITKQITGDKEKKLIETMRRGYEELVARLSQAEKAELEKIIAYFSNLHGLIAAAFNVDLNIRLASSIELCRVLDVPEKEIIHDTDELDDFMLL